MTVRQTSISLSKFRTPSNQVPFLDIGQTCMFGSIPEDLEYGLHTCQSTKGTSGSPIVIIERGKSPVFFGVHVDAFPNNTSSKTTLNVALTIPDWIVN